VAAGNENTDASTKSPARAATAFTVGASNIDDERWSKSNYGAFECLSRSATLLIQLQVLLLTCSHLGKTLPAVV
jgi:hypothetical protein